MLTIFVRNGKIIQSTGMSFAVVGTTIHVLNVSNLMTPTLSHTWSAIAIVGFFMTASSPLGKSLIEMKSLISRRQRSSPASIQGIRNDDVSLP
jgi:hypothetical protein